MVPFLNFNLEPTWAMGRAEMVRTGATLKSTAGGQICMYTNAKHMLKTEPSPITNKTETKSF
jgi:hypothetical protein